MGLDSCLGPLSSPETSNQRLSLSNGHNCVSDLFPSIPITTLIEWRYVLKIKSKALNKTLL